MAEVTILHSGFLHGGFFPDLLDCIEIPWGQTGLSYDQWKISNGVMQNRGRSVQAGNGQDNTRSKVLLY